MTIVEAFPEHLMKKPEGSVANSHFTLIKKRFPMYKNWISESKLRYRAA
jgi:hypothetical protein